MKNKTLVWIGVYALVGYFAYSYFYSKKSSIKTIISTGNYGGTPSILQDFDASFLRMWANAAKNKQVAFLHKGKVYNTNGGKAKA